MKINEKDRTRRRVYVVGALYLLGLCTVLFRAYELQIVEREHLAGIARDGYTGVVKLPPRRGTIYDRKHHELALSLELGSVFAHPRQIGDKPKTAADLGRILGENPKELLALLEKDRNFVWLQRCIPPNKATQIRDLNIQGIGIVTETSRFYPCKEVAAHVIGFVGTDYHGLEGVEKVYDESLRGPERELVQMRDALKRPFAVDRALPSDLKPHDLVLTIDKDIQYSAQQALKEAVESSGAVSGNLVAVDPFTGEILAMAVFPDFNPNLFSACKPDEWRNRTVVDCFEPGSVIKPFLLSAALEQGVATPYTPFDCEDGAYAIGGHVIHDTHKHGILTAADIVILSSNIGAAKLGQRVGYETFYRYLKKFGFEQETGIDLLGERSGFIRPPAEAQIIDQANAYFGQGLTVTTLQLAMAMAAISNGGLLMRPYLVKAVESPTGEPVRTSEPVVVRRVISERTARTMVSILEGVTRDQGTATRAAVTGFHVGGKTGTAQKVDANGKGYAKGKYMASFIGFVPSDRARLVLAVVLDEPKQSIYGGIVAAPVFSTVAQRALNQMGVPPQIRWEEKEIEVTHSPLIAERELLPAVPFLPETGLPDFTGLGMREVLVQAQKVGLDVSLIGSGYAVRQQPAPGSGMERGHLVTVFFEPPA